MKEAKRKPEKKEVMKEDEAEAETEKEVEEEAEKEAEDETEKEVEDDEPETEEAKERKKKRKEAKKGEQGGENPEESAQVSTTEGHSTSPNFGVPSTQHVFVQPSGVHVPREATSGSSLGQSPSDVHFGKSVNPDLIKSPLFVELSKGISAMQDAISKKLDSVEKSFNDRVINMNKKLEAIESFYKQPFYKSANENINPEAIIQESITEKVAKGKVRYSS